MKWRQLLSWFLCAVMLMALVPAGALSASGEESVSMDRLTRFGRTYVKDDTLYLFWTNAGFSFRFNGTGATATVTADNQTQIYWGYLNVYIDGEFTPSQTICLDKATQTVTLAADLPAGEHTVEVRKRNEAAYGGSSTIGVKDLTVAGELLDPPAAPTRRIEVIGDSITSGFGNLDPTGDHPMFTTELEEGTMTYAVLAAKQLGANASIVSRSGIGFCRGADKTDSIYTYYDKTASLPGKTGNDAAWDFAANPSDVVVINLGTNDNGATIDQKPIPAATMTAEAVAFLRLVREKNPNAIIIWTYGLMGNGARAALEAAVKTLADEGDTKVFYLPLEDRVTTTEGVGTHGHPSMQTDINRSAALANFIAEKTGWERDASAMLRAQIQHSAPFATEENLKNYTAMTANRFTKALENGRALLANTSATSAEREAAANAIWQAYIGLMASSDMSAEYTVIDAFDDTTGMQFGNGKGAIDTDDCREGAGAVSVTGSSGLLCANRLSYNLTLPEDWQEWYLEGWIYVSDPSALPGESCLEVSQAVDSVEISWSIGQLGLKAGWNKIQLKMGESPANVSKDKMKTLKNIRFYMVNVQKEITVKLDQFVLARGKAAANITAWQEAVAKAEALLAANENATLRAAYERALAATTQADVDVTTALLTAAINEAEHPAVAEIVPGKHPELVTLYGRTSTAKNGNVTLFWTNSGLSFRFKGTGATAKLGADNLGENANGYLNVYVDGEFTPSQTICMDKTNKTVTLAEGLTDGEHTIELRKRNEAVYGGSASILIKNLTVTGGEFLDPPAAPTRRIEVIGDSITSGFGNIATDADTNYSSSTVEGTLTYAVLAAKELGANASIVSRSGIGFCQGADSMDSFYTYYDKIAALPGTAVNNAEWDFAANPSDVVVINLGTNDNGAKIDGKAITDEQMTAEAVAFLRLVREKNPNATIIWTYGMMGGTRRAALEAAVKTLADAGDAKVFYLPLENYNAATEGVRLGHPTVQADINRSIVLAQFIAEKTGWDVNARPMLQAQLQESAAYNNDDALKNYTEASAKAFRDAYAAGVKLAQADADNAALIAAANDVWMAKVGLLALSDISDAYIVLNPMDNKKGWSLGGAPNGVDSEDFVEGTGCLYTTWNNGTMININTTALKADLPEDWQNWYLECWMYVDHPENIPGGSCIELSQVVDSIEIQWGLDGLGLKAGWNKVQLRLGGGSLSRPEEFKTVKNLRMFIVNMTAELTFKVDNIVLSKGRVAANTATFDATLAEAKALLEKVDDAALKKIVELADMATSQADVDALTPRLRAAIDAVELPADVTLGDVNGDGAIDTADAVLILQRAAKLIDDTALSAAAADVNGDGAIDTADAVLVLQKAAKLIDEFPKK